MFGKKKLKLNEGMLYFQQITADGEEVEVLNLMLNSNGWATCPMIAKSENHTIEETLDGLNSLIDKGLVWWTEINEVRWYRIKPMYKDETRLWDKKFKQRGVK